MTTPRPLPLLCASPAIEAGLAGLGRTEDVKFSPSGMRVALADFNAKLIWVLEVDCAEQGRAEQILINHLTRLESPDLCLPHGLCWLGEERIVVANREGAVQVFVLERPLGKPTLWRRNIRAEQTLSLGLSEGESSPGSLALRTLAPGLHELMVCHNYANLLSHHIIGGPDSIGRYWYSAASILLRAGLDTPDGVAISPDGRWIAISNHGTGEVLIHENTPELGPDSVPVGVLQGVRYPHGLSFTPDGRALLVSDAGLPFLHIFDGGADGWGGRQVASASLQVLDQQAYKQENVNVAEGGPKGLDMRADGLLVLTCKARPLAFYRLAEMGAKAASAHNNSIEPTPEAVAMAFVARHLKAGLATAEVLQARRDATLARFKSSLSWRLTAGLRWLARCLGAP